MHVPASDKLRIAVEYVSGAGATGDEENFARHHVEADVEQHLFLA